MKSNGRLKPKPKPFKSELRAFLPNLKQTAYRAMATGGLSKDVAQAYRRTFEDYLWLCAEVSLDPVPFTLTAVAVYLVWCGHRIGSAASLGKFQTATKRIGMKPPYRSNWLADTDKIELKDLRAFLDKQLGGGRGPSALMHLPLFRKLVSYTIDTYPTLAAVVMVAFYYHMFYAMPRSDSLLNDCCFPSSYVQSYEYQEHLQFYYTRLNPTKMQHKKRLPQPAVFSSSSPACKPLQALRRLHKATGCAHAYPLVDLKSGEVHRTRRLTYDTALRRFKKALSAIIGQAAAATFGLHSFRGGGTCAALARGVPTFHIRLQAVWAPGSKMMEHYAEMAIEQRLEHF